MLLCAPCILIPASLVSKLTHAHTICSCFAIHDPCFMFLSRFYVFTYKSICLFKSKLRFFILLKIINYQVLNLLINYNFHLILTKI